MNCNIQKAREDSIDVFFSEVTGKTQSGNSRWVDFEISNLFN